MLSNICFGTQIPLKFLQNSPLIQSTLCTDHLDARSGTTTFISNSNGYDMVLSIRGSWQSSRCLFSSSYRNESKNFGITRLVHEYTKWHGQGLHWRPPQWGKSHEGLATHHGQPIEQYCQSWIHKGARETRILLQKLSHTARWDHKETKVWYKN